MVEDNERRLGILCVSRQLLVQSIGLPPDTLVEDARVSFAKPDVIEFRIAHPGLPVVAEGEAIRRVDAYLESVEPEVKPRTRFVRWKF